MVTIWNAGLTSNPGWMRKRLIEGYRSILRRVYNPDAYYERVLSFLNEYRPAHYPRRSLSDCLALMRSIVRQGIFGNTRWSYWKFILTAATRHHEAFGTAITLAIMGYHLQMLTR